VKAICSQPGVTFDMDHGGALTAFEDGSPVNPTRSQTSCTPRTARPRKRPKKLRSAAADGAIRFSWKRY
jgi:hypothetical protein